MPSAYSIPQCIHNVPYAKRKYLSPIYLHTSLGRSAGTNPFVEYRSLTGQMGYSKNRRTFVLYSGMIGAFLLTIVGIIHPYVMPVTGSNKIILIYPLIILMIFLTRYIMKIPITLA